MPYRTFADEHGNSWEIWDVRPVRTDRRDSSDRRQQRSQPWTGLERRANPDRRKEHQFRIKLQPPLDEGWLVFKCGDEKRRLAPIPDDWENCRGAELRELWAKAEIIESRMNERSA